MASVRRAAGVAALLAGLAVLAWVVLRPVAPSGIETGPLHRASDGAGGPGPATATWTDTGTGTGVRAGDSEESGVAPGEGRPRGILFRPEVPPGETIREHTVARCRVIGSVRDASTGAPVAGAGVRLLVGDGGQDAGDHRSVGGVSRPDGGFEIPLALGGGRNQLTLWHPDFLESRIPVELPLDGTWDAGVVELDPGTWLTGEVVTDGGAPVPHVTVAAWPGDATSARIDAREGEARVTWFGQHGALICRGAAAECDAHGRFRLGPVEPGRTQHVEVRIHPADRAIAVAERVDTPAEGLRLVASRAALVTIRVAGARRPLAWLALAHRWGDQYDWGRARRVESDAVTLPVAPGEKITVRVATLTGACETDIGPFAMAAAEVREVTWDLGDGAALPRPIVIELPGLVAVPGSAMLGLPDGTETEAHLVARDGDAVLPEPPPPPFTAVIHVEGVADRVLLARIPAGASHAKAAWVALTRLRVRIAPPGAVDVGIRRSDGLPADLLGTSDGEETVWSARTTSGVLVMGEGVQSAGFLLPGEVEVRVRRTESFGDPPWRRVILPPGEEVVVGPE